MAYLPLSVPFPTYNAQIGRFTSFGPYLVLRTWIPGEKIIIGKYCSIADGVTICTGGMHRTDLAALFAFDPARAYRGTKNTTIGNVERDIGNNGIALPIFSRHPFPELMRRICA
jgi:acetyltransferase-like isoleucine patch superfamily enzyme